MARDGFFDGDCSHRCQPQKSGSTALCDVHWAEFPALRAQFSMLIVDAFSAAEMDALDNVVAAAMLPEDWRDFALVMDEDYGTGALTDWRYFRQHRRPGTALIKFSEQAGEPPNGYGQPDWWEAGDQE